MPNTGEFKSVLLIGNSGSFKDFVSSGLQRAHGLRVETISCNTDLANEGCLYPWIAEVDEKVVSFSAGIIVYIGGEVRNKKLMVVENVTRLAMLGELSLRKNLKLIYLSSLSVYEGQAIQSVPEIDASSKCMPISDYGITKYAGDQKIIELVQRGLNAHCIRPASIVGGRRRSGSLERVADIARKFIWSRYLKIPTFISYASREEIVNALIDSVYDESKSGVTLIANNISIQDVIWGEVGRPNLLIDTSALIKILKWLQPAYPIKIAFRQNNLLNRTIYRSSHGKWIL